MKAQISAVIGAFALLALGSAGQARGELATVADGFTDPATLVFGGAGETFIDSFDASELDPCLWSVEAGGGYTGEIQAGSFVVSGEGFGDPNTFVGLAVRGEAPFSFY